MGSSPSLSCTMQRTRPRRPHGPRRIVRIAEHNAATQRGSRPQSTFALDVCGMRETSPIQRPMVPHFVLQMVVVVIIVQQQAMVLKCLPMVRLSSSACCSRVLNSTVIHRRSRLNGFFRVAAGLRLARSLVPHGRIFKLMIHLREAHRGVPQLCVYVMIFLHCAGIRQVKTESGRSVLDGQPGSPVLTTQAHHRCDGVLLQVVPADIRPPPRLIPQRHNVLTAGQGSQ